jgi:hypothetical protein
MTNTYQYSIKVNEALESYGAKTHGSLARRVERLKRFTDLKNKRYADDMKVEHARMIANQEREERIQNRVRELQSPPVFLRRNLRKVEAVQEIELPIYVRPASSPYNLRSRSNSYHGLNLLCEAIENGFVNTRRG